MIKKSILGALLVTMLVFTYGMAQAAMIDGLSSSTSAASPTRLYVNPGGLGDALVYGYYNVRDNINYFNVVNTSDTTGVSVKIRFREGHYSAEVLDFFICLSAADRYTGFILPAASAGPGQFMSWDSDTPVFPPVAFGGTVDFKYGDPYTKITATDTMEGYFEIIAINAWADTPGTNKAVATSNECAYVVSQGGIQGSVNPGVTLADAPDSLFGESILFNVDSVGLNSLGLNATAIATCRITPLATAGLGADDPPRLRDCEPLTAAQGLSEVNFAMTRSNLYGVYDIQSALGGSTNYIINFPTKRQSIAVFGDGLPFDGRIETDAGGETGLIIDGVTTLDHCEEILVTITDDAENRPTSQVGTSPRPRSGVNPELCDEVNLIVLGDAIINSDLYTVTIDPLTAGANFDLGWVNIALTAEAGNLTTVGATTSLGLPVIAFSLQDFDISGFVLTPSMVPMKSKTSLQ